MSGMDIVCREAVEAVTEYLDGALPPRERVRLEQHLIVCEGCLAYTEQLRTTIRLTRGVELEGLGPERMRSLLAALGVREGRS